MELHGSGQKNIRERTTILFEPIADNWSDTSGVLSLAAIELLWGSQDSGQEQTNKWFGNGNCVADMTQIRLNWLIDNLLNCFPGSQRYGNLIAQVA